MKRYFEERMQEKLDQLKEAKQPEPIRSDGAGALDLGPRNVLRDGHNPDILVPPATDFGLMPNLRFSFAVALVEVEPGAMREIHWHSNNDELQYYIQGEARMTVFKPGPKARTFNYQAGDVGYVPVGNFHYVQNIGKEKLVFLEIFNSKHFLDISLAQWIAMTPKEVVKSVLNLSDEFLDNVKKESCPIVKYKGFEFPSAKGTPQNIRYFKDFDFKIKKPCNAAKEH